VRLHAPEALAAELAAAAGGDHPDPSARGRSSR
jgi:hypothetical protein